MHIHIFGRATYTISRSEHSICADAVEEIKKSVTLRTNNLISCVPSRPQDDSGSYASERMPERW